MDRWSLLHSSRRTIAWNRVRPFQSASAGNPTIPKWLASTLDENSAIAVDGRSISYAFYQELKQALEPKNIEIVLDLDLITPIWTDRPNRPSAEVFDHPVAFSGVETKQKLADIRKWLNENHADCLLVSTLDDVMWTLNIRGADTLYCPVSESYLIVERDRATAFIDKQKLPAEIEEADFARCERSSLRVRQPVFESAM